MKKRSLTYAASGVNIDAMEIGLKRVKIFAGNTYIKGVLSDIGLFSGLFKVPGNANKVLVASCDGVGTKLKMAIETGIYHTVGQDLVNHCVNDILVQGAKPLFFLDYFSCGHLNTKVMTDVIKGISIACKKNGLALLGGETAEMPGFYKKGDFDLAGFIVGVAEKKNLITGKRIKSGDIIIGLNANGLHTNGYSLARNLIFKKLKMRLQDSMPGTKTTVQNELLSIHRSYLNVVFPLIKENLISGMAHITGGGFTDNVPRILPDGCQAAIFKNSWEIPQIFQFIQESGEISDKEMRKTFNLGIGLILVINQKNMNKVKKYLTKNKEPFFEIGKIEAGIQKVAWR